MVFTILACVLFPLLSTNAIIAQASLSGTRFLLYIALIPLFTCLFLSSTPPGRSQTMYTYTASMPRGKKVIFFTLKTGHPHQTFVPEYVFQMPKNDVLFVK